MVRQADKVRNSRKDAESENTDSVLNAKEKVDNSGTKITLSDFIELRVKEEAEKGAKAAADQWLIPFASELRSHIQLAEKYNINKLIADIKHVLDQLQPLLEVHKFLKELRTDFTRMPECFITTAESSDPPINIYFKTTPENPAAIEIELLDRFHILSEKIKVFEIKFPSEAYESANSYFAEIAIQLESLACDAFSEDMNKLLKALFVQQEAIKKGFIPQTGPNNELRSVIDQFYKLANFDKQSWNISRIVEIDSQRDAMQIFAAAYEDISSQYRNPDNLTISDLPENLRRQAESRAVKYAKAAEEAYRSSDEARCIKLLREISEIPPDTGKINKLLKQLSKTGCDKVCEILSELSKRIEVKSNQLVKIAALFTEQKENAPHKEQTAEIVAYESEVLPPPAENVVRTDASDRELIELILDDFGITEAAARQMLFDSCTSDWLVSCVDLMTGLDSEMIKNILKINPALLSNKNPENFAFYIHTLKETISFCAGLDPYEVFDPLKHPTHFSSMSYLGKTKKAARLLKDTINDVYSSSFKEKSSEVLQNDRERIARMIGLTGIDGELCVAAVLHGFYVDGVLATLPRQIKDEHIRRNLPAEMAVSRKCFLKVMKKLEDRKVVIVVGGKKAANLWYSLQNDPSLVKGDEFRELLQYALETRTRK